MTSYSTVVVTIGKVNFNFRLLLFWFINISFKTEKGCAEDYPKTASPFWLCQHVNLRNFREIKDWLNSWSLNDYCRTKSHTFKREEILHYVCIRIEMLKHERFLYHCQMSCIHHVLSNKRLLFYCFHFSMKELWHASDLSSLRQVLAYIYPNILLNSGISQVAFCHWILELSEQLINVQKGFVTKCMNIL